VNGRRRVTSVVRRCILATIKEINERKTGRIKTIRQRAWWCPSEMGVHFTNGEEVEDDAINQRASKCKFSLSDIIIAGFAQ
jgi:hypothetical protein